MYDVIIVGAGVTGCAVARYLSRCQGSFLVLEREEDVCCGTSKANSAIVHAGFDAAHGSLMAKFNLRGSELMEPLSRELDFPYRRSGSLVVCMSRIRPTTPERPLRKRREKRRARPARSSSADRLRELEPNISPDAVAALWAPTGAIICPLGPDASRWRRTPPPTAFSFQFDTTSHRHPPRKGGHWDIETDKRRRSRPAPLSTRRASTPTCCHDQVSARKLHITPRRGDYCLLDKTTGGYRACTTLSSSCPGTMTARASSFSPTVHGNTHRRARRPIDIDGQGRHERPPPPASTS